MLWKYRESTYAPKISAGIGACKPKRASWDKCSPAITKDQNSALYGGRKTCPWAPKTCASFGLVPCGKPAIDCLNPSFRCCLWQNFLYMKVAAGWTRAMHVAAFIGTPWEVVKKFIWRMWNSMELRSWNCFSSAVASPKGCSIHFPALTLPFVVGYSKLHASVDTLNFRGERGTSSIVIIEMLSWETSAYHWGSGLQVCRWWALCLIRNNFCRLEQSQLLLIKLCIGKAELFARILLQN